MSTKNLYNEEAKEKLTNMVEDVTVAMMATDLGKRPISVVPMHTKRAVRFNCYTVIPDR